MASDRGDRFSFTELALAAGISSSAYQSLTSSPGLLPGGRGIKDFKRLAAIGAFMASGVPLVMAAAIAKAIVQTEFNEADGEAPTGLRFLANKLTKEEITQLPIADETNDYWYHRGLYRQGIRLGKKALSSDVLIEIVDRHFVFFKSARLIQIINPISGETEEANLIGWLDEWKRGSEPQLVHVSSLVKCDPPDAESIERFRLLNAEARAVRANAIGSLTVNISLGIRSALDRLAEHREKPEARAGVTKPPARSVRAKRVGAAG